MEGWSKSFHEREAGKKVININKVFLIFFPVFAVALIVLSFLEMSSDGSFIRHSIESVTAIGQEKASHSHGKKQDPNLTGGISPMGDLNNLPKKKRSLTPRIKIKYRAQQVIIREETQSKPFFPIGTSFMGELLNSIDTRSEGSWIKVRLPHGGKFKGRGFLPKDTILMGTVDYPRKGKKVFINFSKGVLPNGREFDLQAQALDPGDQSVGISGKYHSRRGGRMASILGLSMVSGVTEVLTQKQVLGKSEVITPKATLKNSLYHGVSKVTESEAQRQASQLGELFPYITIPSGTRLIVNLISSLKGVKGEFLEYE